MFVFVHPTALLEQPPMLDPVAELPSLVFYEMCGFWPGQLQEICDNLLLISEQVFSLISQHYRRLVQVLDYHRIIPLLEEWSDTMVLYSGCCRDVLFFTDGKPWKMAKPGRGDTADALVRAAGGDDINCSSRPITMAIMGSLVQKSSMCCKLMACVTPSNVH